MKLRIFAVVAAGLLAGPGPALAQSSVTISGYFKMAVENVKLSQTAKAPNSETRVVDDASRILFTVVEDLGGGLQAIGQYDFRVTSDVGTLAGSGNNYVGLRGKSWGALTLGRHDLHYALVPSEINAKAGSYKAQSVALLAFAGGGGTAVAVNSRTANAVRYDSPSWNGFALTAAYSSNAAAQDADLGSGVRKGRAWNFAPSYTASNWQVGWSNWTSKPDAFAGADERADRLWGYYVWGGFKLGLAWDSARLKAGATGATTSNRTAWSLPLRYATGSHNFYLEYARARDDKATAAADGARMIALAYAYDLSRRTSVGITYARLRNDPGALYNLYNSAAGQGSASAAVAAGEDPRIWAIGMRHAF
jgi:predicted porin